MKLNISNERIQELAKIYNIPCETVFKLIKTGYQIALDDLTEVTT